MEMMDALFSRRSYRGKYKDQPVPRGDLERILEAGLAAPSGCNKQTTSLIAIDDEQVLRQVKAVIDPPIAETAPAAVCVLTRRINAYRDKCFAVQDYSAAIENMLLAITALGYASCWYEGHITDDDRICDRIAQVLNVPKEYDLVAFLPVGIPESMPKAPRKRPFDQRAWFNSFPSETQITFSRFRDEDYEAVCTFLAALNRGDSLHINWNWARWEWMYLHDEMDRTQLDKIGLWWSGDQVVGAAIYDMYPGEGCALWLPAFKSLAGEILDYAGAELQDEDGFALAVNVRDLSAKRLLAQKGYTQIPQTEYILRADLDLLPHAEIPAGFMLRELNPASDGPDYAWLLWQGFDHGDDRAACLASASQTIPPRKHFDSRLNLVLVDAQGNFAAHCGCWFLPGTDYAYVEPVCTIPQYRGLGLGRAIVTEALTRARKLGAEKAYVISDMDFYRGLGFRDCERLTFWKNENNK